MKCSETYTVKGKVSRKRKKAVEVKFSVWFPVVQSLSHVQLFATLACNTPGFSVLHYLLEFAKPHVQWVGDATQPSHPLSPPSPSAFNLSQYPRSFLMNQLFESGGKSIGASASVFPVNIQGWFPLRFNDLISLLSKGLSRVFSNTTTWKHQFFSPQPSLRSNSHICTWLLEKP